MRFEAYISDLLYRYECVVVPEFGAFLTRAVSAQIDETSNTFFPPKKVLSFNEQLKSNDGLLVNYIANVEKIPYESALNKVNKKTRSLKSYLSQGETIALKNVGDLTLNSEGKLQFEPYNNLNYLTEAFGLSQFTSPNVTREVYKKEVEELEKVVPIALTPEKRNSSFLRYASIAVLALTLGGWLSSNYYLGQIEQHNQLAQEEANKEIENRVQEATFVIENPLPAINFNINKQSGNFHIVAGAFRVEENSFKKIKQLKSEGFKARKIGVNKYGLHEVVYGSYEDRLEALQALRTIKKTHNKDAWLKVENLKDPIAQPAPLKTVEEKTEQFGESSIISNSGKNHLSSEYNDVFGKSPNIIPILRKVDNLDQGFYTIIGIYSDVSKRDSFITSLEELGYSDIQYFFDKERRSYFVYNEKFEDLELAKKALKSERNSSFKERIAVIKLED